MTSYHAWTHLPKAQGGTDPLPIAGANPWIAIYDGSTIAANNTWMPVPFTAAVYDPALVTLGFGNIFDLEITDDGDVGNDRYRIITYPKGVYRAELWTEWGNLATAAADGAFAVHNLFQTGAPNSLLSGSEHLVGSADWPSTSLAREMTNNSFLQDTLTIFLNQTPWTWDPHAKHTSGVNRSLNGVRLYVEYLGYSDNSTWTYDSI